MAQQQLESQTASTLAVVEASNEAFNCHDVDDIMNAMTDDCVFEGTGPVPDGARFQGQVAVRAVWERLFSSSPQAYFETEDIFAHGDRCVGRWIYTLVDGDGNPGRLRGVDVFRVRDGKIAEKCSYVKG